MVEIFKTNEESEKLEKISNYEKDSWINITDPDEAELSEIEAELQISPNVIKNIVSEEKNTGIDIDDDMKVIIIDVPLIEKKSRHLYLKTYSFGIIIKQSYILTVCSKDIEFLSGFINNEVKGLYTHKKNRFTLQVLSLVAGEFLKSLQLINAETEKAEHFIGESTQNRELLKLLSIDKSLVYLTTSLKSNEIVFERLLDGKILNYYEEDKDIIEHAIIKNKQAMETAGIYKDILKGLSASFAAISSNNLNNIMKFLAGITIVLSIPTMVASFMGMNVNLGFFSENEHAFLMILGISVFVSVLLALIFKKKNML